MHWLKRLEPNIELKHQYEVSILFVHIDRHNVFTVYLNFISNQNLDVRLNSPGFLHIITH